MIENLIVYKNNDYDSYSLYLEYKGEKHYTCDVTPLYNDSGKFIFRLSSDTLLGENCGGMENIYKNFLEIIEIFDDYVTIYKNQKVISCENEYIGYGMFEFLIEICVKYE